MNSLYKGSKEQMEQATFAAGCFWGVKEAFRQVKGVTSTTAGYTGGHFSNPCYLDVCARITGTQFCVMNNKTFSGADQHSFLEDNLAGKSSCG